MKSKLKLLALAGALALAATTLFAQDAATDDKAAAELAKKLANPVASLISVPIQNNWDFGIGPANAMRYTANIQPVIPFSLNTNWNLITRTIVPVIYAEAPVRGGSSQSGLGDIVQSFWASPKAPTDGGWIWGAGAVMLYPSGTDGLSARHWGAGPTALALKQQNGWTYGALVNHLWSYAQTGGHASSDGGDASDGSDAGVNATFLQPFVSFTTKKFTTLRVEYRVHLQLESIPMDRAVERERQPARQDRRQASAVPTRLEILRSTARWRAGLGHPLHRHVPVPEMNNTQTNLPVAD